MNKSHFLVLAMALTALLSAPMVTLSEEAVDTAKAPPSATIDAASTIPEAPPAADIPTAAATKKASQVGDLSNWTEGKDGRLSPPMIRKDNKPTQAKRLYPDLQPEEPVITVNGDSITWRAMLRHAELMIMEMPLPSGVTMAEFEEKREELTMRRIMRLADNFIIKTLLRQEAERHKLSLTNEEVTARRNAILAEARKTRKNPQAYLDEFARPDSYFSHDLTNSLLFGALREKVIRPTIIITADDLEAAKQKRIATNEEIEKFNTTLRPKLVAIQQRLKDGESFTDLAFSESDCDSSYDGGELGTFKYDELRPEIMDVAFAMKEGTLSDIIETPYSFHIIKLLKKNHALLAEGAAGPAPVISVKLAHIMLEKKEMLPLHTDETARAEVMQERENVAITAMRERLLNAAKIETPFTLY